MPSPVLAFPSVQLVVRVLSWLWLVLPQDSLFDTDLVYANSYTLSGCSNPAHCGVFTRVLAHCMSGELCDTANPTLCNGVPVYQRGGSDGPVLLMYDDRYRYD
eukprot:COSAG02_NODE_26191_length_638_cov_1.584416_1_plen_102_part_01